MERTQELYFHASRVKNIFIFIVMLLFTLFGVVISVITYDVGGIVPVLAGIALALFFGILSLGMLKLILTAEPYLILTEEVLIHNASSRKAVAIEWEDIASFNIRRINFNTFIEIILDDEDKYRNTVKLTKMVHTMTNAKLFSIAWTQIKNKDRAKLVYELDRLSGCGDLLYELVPRQTETEVEADTKGRETARRIDWGYILKAYGISFLLMIAWFLFFYFTTDGLNAGFLLVSFFMYPFAKVIYDVLLGFKLKEIVSKQSFPSIYVRQLQFVAHILLYLFSFYLAPVGVLYLIVRIIYRFIERKNRTDA